MGVRAVGFNAIFSVQNWRGRAILRPFDVLRKSGRFARCDVSSVRSLAQVQAQNTRTMVHTYAIRSLPRSADFSSTIFSIFALFFVSQRPILLKGHERSITYVKYNREGDLIFTCAKDHKPNVWFSSNGERLGLHLVVSICRCFSLSHAVLFPCANSGTFNGHEGAVWALDVNFASTLLLTGSADTTARLWDVQTGRSLFTFGHKAPVRSVGFADGDRQFLSVGDKSLGQDPMIFVWNLAANIQDRTCHLHQRQSWHSLFLIYEVFRGKRTRSIHRWRQRSHQQDQSGRVGPVEHSHLLCQRRLHCSRVGR
jgi:WD40 repeat protein